jgi:hypothetical protein
MIGGDPSPAKYTNANNTSNEWNSKVVVCLPITIHPHRHPQSPPGHHPQGRQNETCWTASQFQEMLQTERRFFPSNASGVACTNRVHRASDVRDDACLECPFQLSSSRKNYSKCMSASIQE